MRLYDIILYPFPPKAILGKYRENGDFLMVKEVKIREHGAEIEKEAPG